MTLIRMTDRDDPSQEATTTPRCLRPAAQAPRTCRPDDRHGSQEDQVDSGGQDHGREKPVHHRQSIGSYIRTHWSHCRMQPRPSAPPSSSVPTRRVTRQRRLHQLGRRQSRVNHGRSAAADLVARPHLAADFRAGRRACLTARSTTTPLSTRADGLNAPDRRAT